MNKLDYMDDKVERNMRILRQLQTNHHLRNNNNTSRRKMDETEDSNEEHYNQWFETETERNLTSKINGV